MRVPVNTGPRLGGDNSVSQVKGPENDLIVYNQIKSKINQVRVRVRG